MSVAEDLNALIAELATGPSTARRRELVIAASGLVKELTAEPATQSKSQPKAPRKGR